MMEKIGTIMDRGGGKALLGGPFLPIRCACAPMYGKVELCEMGGCGVSLKMESQHVQQHLIPQV